MGKRKNGGDPFKKLREWQENQFSPGYYTGGKIPPYANIPSKTSLFGKVYNIGARIVGVFYIIIGAAVFLMIVAGSISV